MTQMQQTKLTLMHATICQALADPKRISIIYALDECPRHVSALAEDLAMPQSTVSRHLRVLRQQSLVEAERFGPSVIYHLVDRRIIGVLDTMQEVLFDAMERRTELMGAD
jgi:DNA-binding transcriptional ArsR family regulator